MNENFVIAALAAMEGNGLSGGWMATTPVALSGRWAVGAWAVPALSAANVRAAMKRIRQTYAEAKNCDDDSGQSVRVRQDPHFIAHPREGDLRKRAAQRRAGHSGTARDRERDAVGRGCHGVAARVLNCHLDGRIDG